MKTLGNILWVLFGGAILALMWVMAGILCCCTIVGIPVGVQCFKFSGFVLWPFGKEIVYGDGTGKFILNILWIVLLGWEMAIASCTVGLFWCITIVGIPFGMQCFKFAKLALMPFGAQIQ